MDAQQLSQELSKKLSEIAYNDQGIIGPILAKLEEGTKVKRDYFVHGAITIFIAYLILGRGAELLCNLIGFAYPAYASIKAIQSSDPIDDTQWLTYWTVFAFFTVLEYGSDQIVGWFPFYWLAKFLFLLWLYLPMTRGAEVVYARVIVPLMEKYTARLEEIENEVKQQMNSDSHMEKPDLDNPIVQNGDTALDEPPITVANGSVHEVEHIQPAEIIPDKHLEQEHQPLDIHVPEETIPFMKHEPGYATLAHTRDNLHEHH